MDKNYTENTPPDAPAVAPTVAPAMAKAMQMAQSKRDAMLHEGMELAKKDFDEIQAPILDFISDILAEKGSCVISFSFSVAAISIALEEENRVTARRFSISVPGVDTPVEHNAYVEALVKLFERELGISVAFGWTKKFPFRLTT